VVVGAGALIVLVAGAYVGWKLWKRLNRPPELAVTLIASGFDQPTDIANSGLPGDARLFVVERPGRIRLVQPDGTIAPTLFLDITERVEDTAYGEQGLLGLAFDPAYAATGDFYVYYTANGGDIHLSHFRVSANPDVADPAETVLLAITPQAPMHLGGDLAFGPDGYLYLGPGDGGTQDDPENDAQRLDSWLGKLLRIQVHGASPYTVPADNPFVNTAGALPEVWALGLRNPWRFSFDPATGDLFVGDVGQATHEEINRVPAGSPAGQNFGWHCYEGLVDRGLAGCSAGTAYTPPLRDFERAEASSIVGGFVYAGNRYRALRGSYIFGDFVSSSLWLLQPGATEPIPYWGLEVFNPSTFGVDVAGELYVASFTAGKLFQVGTK